jgi:hypothetical protein
MIEDIMVGGEPPVLCAAAIVPNGETGKPQMR